MALAVPSIDEAYALEDRYRKERGRVFLTGTQALVRLPLMQRRLDRRGAAHRRLRQRLPRLAARHGRPGAVEGAKAARGRRRPLPARHQRGAGGDRRARHAARRGRPRAHRRRRVRASGTARARASTAPATRSSTATPTARRRTAACWSWPATTTAACRPPCRTRATRPSRPGTCRCCTRPTSPNTSSSASTAGRCRASRAAGSASRRSQETVESAPQCRVELPDRAADFATPDRLHARRRTACTIRWPDLPSLDDRGAPRTPSSTRCAPSRGQPDRPHRGRGAARAARHRHRRQGALRPHGGAAPASASRARRSPPPACASTRSALIFPLEPTRHRRLRRRACDEILVVEEKRPLVERQLKELLYDCRTRSAPRVIGKRDARGRGRSSRRSASCGRSRRHRARRRLARTAHSRRLDRRQRSCVDFTEPELLATPPARRAPPTSAPAARTTRSTKVPEGSRARPASAATSWRPGWTASTAGLIQMGGEGATGSAHRAVHRRAARVPEPGRRHLLPLRPSSRSARRSRPASTSPTRSSSTTPSR